MLDPISGDITLSASFVLQRHSEENVFCQSELGVSATPRLQSCNYHWYSVETLVNETAWIFMLGFHDGKLEFVSMAPVTEGTSWDSFSVERERQVAIELQRTLGAWVGRPPSKHTAAIQRYDFDWGSVSAGLVPQDATASISVRYN